MAKAQLKKESKGKSKSIPQGKAAKEMPKDGKSKVFKK